MVSKENIKVRGDVMGGRRDEGQGEGKVIWKENIKGREDVMGRGKDEGKGEGKVVKKESIRVNLRGYDGRGIKKKWKRKRMGSVRKQERKSRRLNKRRRRRKADK